MGMISGTVTVNGSCVTAPTNLLFRVSTDYSKWVKVGVNSNWQIVPKDVPAGEKHIQIRVNNDPAKPNGYWARVDSPHPFDCVSAPQDISVRYTCS